MEPEAPAAENAAADCVADPWRDRPATRIETTLQRATCARTRLSARVMFLIGVDKVSSPSARGGGTLAIGVIVGLLLAVLGRRARLPGREDGPPRERA